MDNDNSTAKRVSFEARVFRYLNEPIKSGGHGFLPSVVKLKRHTKYYSKGRNSYLEVDIVPEVYRRGALEHFLFWIWECKNNSKPVPVDDIEEFHATLQQIGANKTKGTIATAGSVQKSAVHYAESQGIGLVRISPQGSVFYLQESKRFLMFTVENGLSILDTNLLESHFIGLTPSYCYALPIEDY